MQMQSTEAALPSKQNIAAFVHGIAKMEVQAFTLRETAKKIQKEISEKESHINHQLSATSKDLEEKKKIVHAISNERFLKEDGWPTLFQSLLHGFLITFLIVWVAMIIGEYLLELPEDVALWYPIYASPIILLACQPILWYISYHSYTKSKQKRLAEAQLTFEQANQTYMELLETQRKTEKLRYAVDRKFADLETAASYIEGRLRQCYDLNIIPPSYRQLVYVVLLDEIFINDKADTMRDAILICDTEVRHAELITKLDDIYHSLQALAEHIRGMGMLLNNIQANTCQISDHIVQMADDQQRIAYAAEAVQHTAENADIFMYQRRTGII